MDELQRKSPSSLTETFIKELYKIIDESLKARARSKFFYAESTDYKCFQYIYPTIKNREAEYMTDELREYIRYLLSEFLEKEASVSRKGRRRNGTYR